MRTVWDSQRNDTLHDGSLRQSAFFDLLEKPRLTGAADRIRVAAETLCQELIDAEAAAFILYNGQPSSHLDRHTKPSQDQHLILWI